MEKSFSKALADIKSLKVQGAENVAQAGVDALAKEMRSFKGNSVSFFRHLRHSISLLKATRPTEPALRNSLRFILAKALEKQHADVEELKHEVSKTASEYKKHSLETKLAIGELGSKLVPRNGIVLTHCHSSTVMRALKKAKDAGKKFEVFCLETRPRYQGHTSAKELSDYGIKTTLFVDGAVNFALSKMRDSDVCLVGADAITVEGDLVNKIGTKMVAQACLESGKKLYSLTGSHKFDGLTQWGEEEPIEMREANEVLDEKTRKGKKISAKLKVLNPAFDLVEAKYLTAYVTELGLIPPESMLAAVSEKNPSVIVHSDESYQGGE